MVKNNAITLYLSEEDEAKITEASKKVALSKASFCRTLALNKAKKILLKENKKEVEASITA